MEKTCRQCSAGFVVTDEDLAFYDKVSPVFNGKKELIPPPTLCPDCRAQRRMAWRNHCYVYRNATPSPQSAGFSMWTPDSPFPSYENSLWFSDTWDQHTSCADIDLNRPMFPQCKAVQDNAPHFALDSINMENSDYSNNADHSKNCYLCFNVTRSEDCIGCDTANASMDCIDCTRITECERCADCIDCERCYGLQDSRSCENCSDSIFLLNCRSCTNCIGCVNMNHREYCVFNEQKTPEEYARIMEHMQGGSWEKRQSLREHFDAFALTQPQPHAYVRMAEEVTGNYLVQCRNIHESAFIHTAEHLRYCQFLFNSVHHCQDVTLFGIHAEYDYESCIVGLNAQLCHFCVSVWEDTSNMLYSTYCVHCSDCFGCTGLRRKQYCILNKQYTKEEYEELMPKIIEHMRQTGEWGEFMPIKNSPVPYNKSLAQWYFPLSKEDAEARNYRWYDERMSETTQAIDTIALPDDLPPTDDPIVAKSVLSGRPFKITNQEIRRYRQFNVPLPRMTYDERMEERAQKLGGIRLYDRTCTKTGKPIKTTIPPDSPWIVWDREEWEREFRS